MDSNKVIYIAALITRAALWFCYVALAGFLVLMAWWLLDPAALSGIELSGSAEARYGIGDFRFGVSPSEAGEGSLLMSELGPLMAGWLLVRAGIFFVITISILRRCIEILYSIHNLRTFYIDNIRHFQMIARFALAGFLLSCFNFGYVGGTYHIQLNLAFTPLLLWVASLVLAEIFKEGKRLVEERDLIV